MSAESNRDATSETNASRVPEMMAEILKRIEQTASSSADREWARQGAGDWEQLAKKGKLGK